MVKTIFRYKLNTTILHHETLPSVQFPDGDCLYYINGKLSRELGPAVDFKKVKCYYINGLLHNTSGPAVIRDDGIEEYYLNGELLTKKRWVKKRTNISKT